MNATVLIYNDFTTAGELKSMAAESEGDLFIVRDGIQLSQTQMDEMRQCLTAAEMHGFVSPRINDGSLLSLPYDLPVTTNLPQEKLDSLLQTAKGFLTRFHRVPQPSPSCVLVRRSVIQKLGFWETNYRTVSAALLAYYCEACLYGFNAVAANYVFVSGPVTHPFNDAIENVEDYLVHSSFLQLQRRTKQYLAADMSAGERFLSALDPLFYDKPRILLDYTTLAIGFDGTTEVQLSFLKYMWENYSDKYEICVLTRPAADDFHHLRKQYRHVYYPDTIQGNFHIAYLATPPFYPEQFEFLNNHCLKVVFTMLDMISSRCDYLWINSNKSPNIIRWGMKLCDAMISLSDASTRDYRNFFAGEAEMLSCPMETIYIASKQDSVRDETEVDGEALPFERYILIAGNPYAHKMIRETVQAVKTMDHNFIVIGNQHDEQITRRIQGLRNGLISENKLGKIYSCCELVVFPSLYEGFGLPVVNALKLGKHVIVYDNEINRELLRLLADYADQIFFYKRVFEIPALIETALAKEWYAPAQYRYTWAEVVTQMEAYLDWVRRQRVDMAKLQKRLHSINLFLRFRSCAIPGAGGGKCFWRLLKDRIIDSHPRFGNAMREGKRLGRIILKGGKRK